MLVGPAPVSWGHGQQLNNLEHKCTNSYSLSIVGSAAQKASLLRCELHGCRALLCVGLEQVHSTRSRHLQTIVVMRWCQSCLAVRIGCGSPTRRLCCEVLRFLENRHSLSHVYCSTRSACAAAPDRGRATHKHTLTHTCSSVVVQCHLTLRLFSTPVQTPANHVNPSRHYRLARRHGR